MLKPQSVQAVEEEVEEEVEEGEAEEEAAEVEAAEVEAAEVEEAEGVEAAKVFRQRGVMIRATTPNTNISNKLSHKQISRIGF